MRRVHVAFLDYYWQTGYKLPAKSREIVWGHSRKLDLSYMDGRPYSIGGRARRSNSDSWGRR